MVISLLRLLFHQVFKVNWDALMNFFEIYAHAHSNQQNRRRKSFSVNVSHKIISFPFMAGFKLPSPFIVETLNRLKTTNHAFKSFEHSFL